MAIATCNKLQNLTLESNNSPKGDLPKGEKQESEAPTLPQQHQVKILQE